MKSGLLALVVLAAALTWWFMEASRKPAPALPDLQGLEPAVKQVIEDAHRDVVDNPDGPARLRWAKVLHAHDFFSEAVEAYGAAEPLLEGEARFEALYLEGCAWEKLEPARAVAVLRRACEERTDYRPLWLRLGALDLQLNRPDEARKDFEAANALREDAHSCLGLGRVALRLGRIDQARRWLEKGRALDGGNQELNALLVTVLRRQGRLEKARALAAEVGEAEEKSPFPDPIQVEMLALGASFQNRLRFAIEYLKAGDFVQALAWAEKCLSSRPSDGDALLRKGMALARLGRLPEALVVLEPLARRRPDDAAVLEELASALAASGKGVRALQLLDRALKIEPNRVHAHYLRGVILQKARPLESESELRWVIGRRPGHLDARLYLARVLESVGRKEEARREVEAILSRRPEHRGALALKAKLDR
ncbi:MAG TPA: tetratricopeptide repeat protein [Planctomycetes bacterium]|nr:tetratricopeptide repeat protein [Planctomycetota bacterium]